MPMQMDNNTASDIINGIFNQARSKAIDMRYYWLMDRAQQRQLRIYWDRGIKNLADYLLKASFRSPSQIGKTNIFANETVNR